MVQVCSIEYLPNIRQLIISISLKEQDDAENNQNTPLQNTKLFLNRSVKLIHTKEEEQTCASDLLISLPGSIGIDNLALPIEGDRVENYPQISRIDDILILQFRNVLAAGTLGTLLDLPSSKLIQEHAKELICSSCRTSLMSFKDGNIIFKDLPNEHWLELLDCWSCHDNEFAPIAEKALNQKVSTCHGQHSHHEEGSREKKSYDDLNNESSGLILPPAGKIFISSSHILVNKDDFCSLECPHCHYTISEKVHDTHIKVFRDSVAFKGDSAFEFPKESFLELLMLRILDTIDNHSTFHFYLKSSAACIYLKPLNWNVQVFDFKSKTWKMAFKVGYSLDASNIISDAEVISCTTAQFDLVLKALESNHEELLFNSALKLPGSDRVKISYLAV